MDAGIVDLYTPDDGAAVHLTKDYTLGERTTMELLPGGKLLVSCSLSAVSSACDI